MDISISIVWINMLESDSERAARVSAQIVKDPHVRHFHDPEKRVGKAIAEGIGGEGQVAWDMYLFYASGGEWRDEPPAPFEWAHQLSAPWIEPTRFHWGDDLVRTLCKTMGKLADAQRIA